MKMLIYVIYDSKVEAYNQPWYCPTKAAAIRNFSDLVNDSKSAIAAHPEDYTLFEVGSVDMNTCKFDIHPTLLSLGIGHEFVRNS